MSKDKKLFDSEDFNKQKKLFTPADFDKESESSVTSNDDCASTSGNDNEQTPPPSPETGFWRKYQKHILCGAAIVTVVASIIIIPKNISADKSEDNPIAGVTDNTKTSTTTVNEKDSTASDANDVISLRTGSDASETQNTGSAKNEVNNQGSTDVKGSDVTIEGTTEALANDVIVGKYANWPERERKLGKRYKEIQSKVNEMYRNGLVK